MCCGYGDDGGAVGAYSMRCGLCVRTAVTVLAIFVIRVICAGVGMFVAGVALYGVLCGCAYCGLVCI